MADLFRARPTSRVLLLSVSSVKRQAVESFLRQAADASASSPALLFHGSPLASDWVLECKDVKDPERPQQPLLSLEGAASALADRRSVRAAACAVAWQRVVKARSALDVDLCAYDLVIAVENVVLKTEPVFRTQRGVFQDCACVVVLCPASGAVAWDASPGVQIPDEAVQLWHDADQNAGLVTFGDALHRLDPEVFSNPADWCGSLSAHALRTRGAIPLGVQFESREMQIKTALQTSRVLRSSPYLDAVQRARQACVFYPGFRGVGFLSIAPALATASDSMRLAAAMAVEFACHILSFETALLRVDDRSSGSCNDEPFGAAPIACVAPLASRGLYLAPHVHDAWIRRGRFMGLPTVVVEKADAAPAGAMWTREYAGAYRPHASLGIQKTLATAALLQGANVLLLDDVVETGGSLEAAALLLRDLGAARIVALVAYAVPDTRAAAVARLARLGVTLVTML